MVTRAIHVELVDSIDTDSFINALQRLISRRGKPNTILLDCGLNFKDAVEELKLEHDSVSQMKITDFTKRQHIVWKFNPPRLVRVVKTSLYNIAKDRTLTDFQIITVFTEVENMANN